ncbi:hypothetical protein BDW74DRAFT_164213 [Aspergillus multicolor]|uniref:uncharacterized protein n=1 Tax=Aspergillus multicolor TaxID=41759 RepID=UPI003CCE365D
MRAVLESGELSVFDPRPHPQGCNVTKGRRFRSDVIHVLQGLHCLASSHAEPPSPTKK